VQVVVKVESKSLVDEEEETLKCQYNLLIIKKVN
jgi:hypothetical protein